MKKLALVLALLLIMPFVAGAEEKFDGDVYDAYRPIYNEAYLRGWEIVSYIEPSGLLLSAVKDGAEISVSIQESMSEPDAFLTTHVAGVTRYGKDIKDGRVSSLSLDGYEKAARVEYAYRSLRDSGEGAIYRVEMVACKLKSGFILTLSLTSWGESAAQGEFVDDFVRSFRLESVKISTDYTVLLTNCEARSDGIYVTLDYCDVEFEEMFGMGYAVNKEEKLYDYKLRPDAGVWLPELSGALYSLYAAGADEVEISIAIESYYNKNLTYAVYMVLFDQNGQIIRMQHYNVL